MNTSFFQELLGSIAERGRALVDRSATRPAGKGARRAKQPETLESLCRALVSGRGEASGVALARQVLDLYAASPVAARVEFFRLLASDFDPELGRHPAGLGSLPAGRDAREPAGAAAGGRAAAPGAVPAPQPGTRRHGGPGPRCARISSSTAARMRSCASVDDDLAHLLSSWFNRGFLVLRRIDWSTPADILERIIRYEAVHEIQGWDDLRRRVQPTDRRCFAFFHPSLIDEPLIFVEVALTREIPGSIQGLLAEEREVLPASEATTAVFYSISNCQPGLARRLVRQFPDQAGGRGAVARAAVAHDLRHPVAGARASRPGSTGRSDPRLPASPGSTLGRCRTGRRLARRRGVAERRARCLLDGRLLSHAPRVAAASRSTRWPASISATAPGSSASTGSATRRRRACARRMG